MTRVHPGDSSTAEVSRPGVRTRPAAPARYRVTVAHRRRDPFEYAFTQRSWMWLVDVDDLPVLPGPLGRLVRFDAADHFGDPADGLRAAVDAFCAGHGLRRPAHVLMLANPRVFGYVFNPLSVFYLYDADGTIAHCIAEVRNTYGGRHVYLAQVDGSGRADLEKVFYVSPFYPVDGDYTMLLPEPDEHLRVSVTMRRPGDRPFVATVSGLRVPHRGRRPVLLDALRSPLATRAVMAGIRRHGITLFLKGLRPYPRTDERGRQVDERDRTRSAPEKEDQV